MFIFIFGGYSDIDQLGPDLFGDLTEKMKILYFLGKVSQQPVLFSGTQQ
jgi:hypothetical protein